MCNCASPVCLTCKLEGKCHRGLPMRLAASLTAIQHGGRIWADLLTPVFVCIFTWFVTCVALMDQRRHKNNGITIYGKVINASCYAEKLMDGKICFSWYTTSWFNWHLIFFKALLFLRTWIVYRQRIVSWYCSTSNNYKNLRCRSVSIRQNVRMGNIIPMVSIPWPLMLIVRSRCVFNSLVDSYHAVSFLLYSALNPFHGYCGYILWTLP